MVGGGYDRSREEYARLVVYAWLVRDMIGRVKYMIGRVKNMLGYAGKYDELRSAFLLLLMWYPFIYYGTLKCVLPNLIYLCIISIGS